MKTEFLYSLSKNIQLAIFMKLSPVEAEMFHADRRKDGQTDMTQLIVAYRNFLNAPKMISVGHSSITRIKIIFYLAQLHSSSSCTILSSRSSSCSILSSRSFYAFKIHRFYKNFHINFPVLCLCISTTVHQHIKQHIGVISRMDVKSSELWTRTDLSRTSFIFVCVAFKI